MALQKSLRAPVRAAERRGLALLGYAGLALVVLLWTFRALQDSSGHDSALAYVGGQFAWSTGHPEQWFSWTGTPFLAGIYAVASQVASSAAIAQALTVLNVALVVGSAAILLRRLRPVVSSTTWWILAFAVLSFGPIMSSVWEKQVNIICFVLALGGFEMLRRGRTHRGALLIAVSLSFKPLAILLPFALLGARQTRRAGAWALAYLVALNVGVQALLAAHAGSTSALNLWLAVKNFSTKSKPAGGLACSVDNFSPQSLLCRLAGPQHWGQIQVVALLGVGVLVIWILVALRGRPPLSWDVFAYTCAISIMVSPISWSHYQIMLAPLFVLLLVRFVTDRADIGDWVGLAVAFVLVSLSWSPYGTVTDALRFRFSNAFVFNAHPLIPAVAQFGQYFLIVTALLSEARRTRLGGPAHAP